MDIRLLRSIFLIRHGQALSSATDRMGGGLTDLGQRQAELAARRLSHYPIQIVYTSTLRRAADPLLV
jgi:broad specificity phosphatase PhoE